VNYYDNSASSTYHSLQVTATKRLSRGFMNQLTYTWSRALDVLDGDGILSPRDPNNARLEKGRAGFDRTHVLTNYGTWELPFGPNRAFFSGGPAWVQRLAERWQLGGIFNLSTGAPLTVTAPVSTLWQSTAANTPVALGELPAAPGITYVANGVTYFPGITQIQDPGVNAVTTTNNVRGSYSNLSIADANGNALWVNPTAGEVGTLGRNVIEGPGNIRLDLNLIKRVRFQETREFEFRVDVVNALNHPNFGNPTLNINSTNFGRITSASGSRRFTFNARINF
jgi:hypothetical protein